MGFRGSASVKYSKGVGVLHVLGSLDARWQVLGVQCRALLFMAVPQKQHEGKMRLCMCCTLIAANLHEGLRVLHGTDLSTAAFSKQVWETLGPISIKTKLLPLCRWYPKTLKTRDPLVVSVGWRRFQVGALNHGWTGLPRSLHAPSAIRMLRAPT